MFFARLHEFVRRLQFASKSLADREARETLSRERSITNCFVPINKTRKHRQWN